MAASPRRIQHPFGPLFGPDSRVLILGSFPSVKSREQNFFYGHPQNRFWKVIAALYGEKVPGTINGRKSHEMYEKYIRPQLGIEAGCLPSTSPANAQWSLEKLTEAWSAALKDA